MNGPRRRKASRPPAWAGFIEDHAPPLGAAELSRFTGKRILITGAGGFLGSALARQLARTAPAHLTLLDIAEYGLFRLGQHLRARSSAPGHSLVVGSVHDRALVEELFSEGQPEIVFHAAARKHVPLMEDNLFAAVETNVLGTLALAEAAQRSPIQSFVLLSTDKAVDPISIMGATKRIAEGVVLAAHAKQRPGAAFTCLRLCNVLGSTGSVAPLFVRQIAAGGPVTLTHPEATRLFLSRRDALRHTLRAAVTETRTGLLVPPAPRANRIEDLANFLLLARTAGQGRAVAIAHTGLRPADKLHEQLLSEAEQAEPTASGHLLEVTTRIDHPALHRLLPAVAEAVASRDGRGLQQLLRSLVPEFQPDAFHASAALETPA